MGKENKMESNQPIDVKYREGLRMINSVAFYDFDVTKLKLKEAFYDILQFIEDQNLKPDYISSDYNKKTVLFKNGLRLLEKKGFEDAGDITLKAVQKDAIYNSLDHGWDFDCSISHYEDPLNYFCFDANLFPFSITFYEKFILNQLKFCDFNYAFYYEREYQYGPQWYAMGLIYNDEKSKEDGWEIAHWNNRYSGHFIKDKPRFGYYTGLLRDIYPINIIIKDHLTQRVGKGTLEDWIKNGKNRGTLHQLTDKHTSWRVPHEDIDAIRQALIPWRLLVAFNEIDCTPRTMTQEQIDALIAKGDW